MKKDISKIFFVFLIFFTCCMKGGDSFAVRLSNGDVQIRSIHSGKVLKTLKIGQRDHRGERSCVSSSFVADYSYRYEDRDKRNYKELEHGHPGFNHKVKFSLDKKYLILDAYLKGKYEIQIWDAKDLKKKKPIKVLKDFPAEKRVSSRFSPQGRYLIVKVGKKWVLDDTIVCYYLWDTQDWDKEPRIFKGKALFFSPDEKYCVIDEWRDKKRIFYLWDIQNWDSRLVLLEGLDFSINSLRFSPDGNCFAFLKGKKEVEIWETGPLHKKKTIIFDYERESKDDEDESGCESELLDTESESDDERENIKGVTFSPNGRHLIVKAKYRRHYVYNTSDFEEEPKILYWDDILGFSPDGKYIVLFLQGEFKRFVGMYYKPIYDSKLLILETSKWSEKTSLEVLDDIMFSLDGRYIILCEGGTRFGMYPKGFINAIFDTENWEEVEGGYGLFLSIVQSIDEKSLILSLKSHYSEDSKIQVWNIENEKQIALDEGLSKGNLFWTSPDGRFLIKGIGKEIHEIKSVQMWDILEWQERYIIKSSHGIVSLIFPPENELSVKIKRQKKAREKEMAKSDPGERRDFLIKNMELNEKLGAKKFEVQMLKDKSKSLVFPKFWSLVEADTQIAGQATKINKYDKEIALKEQIKLEKLAKAKKLVSNPFVLYKTKKLRKINKDIEDIEKDIAEYQAKKQKFEEELQKLTIIKTFEKEEIEGDE